MIRFLLKGLIRDKNRSRLPVLVVALGVMFTVFLYCYLTGVIGDMINFNAKYSTGHVKIVTQSYKENMDIMPLDLSLTNTDELLAKVRERFPETDWVKRIQFGGLIDVPDENGETKEQGTAVGLALDLFSENSSEIERMQLNKALVKGTLPDAPGEVLLSDDFASKLGIEPGAEITFIGSTMFGGMAIHNFTLAGTVRFGITMLDKGALITDLQDARLALDMQNASSEILGFNSVDYYDDELAIEMSEEFNSELGGIDEFDPVMLSLRDSSGMSMYLDLINGAIGLISAIFIFALSIILWNTGLIGGIRRYGEVGMRLAIGETKGHVYRSMIAESLSVGLVGSVIGTIIGLGLSYWLQVQGIDISHMLQDSTLLMPGVFRARITADAYYIGFIPGLLSTAFGTMLAGIGIYRRQTANLFKELQA
ncbi:MAG: FtsX-like permease family protein [Bacteroidota bacterium]|nr:FtsX-like permease family protein [Bacteroidota bacterium]